MNPYRFRGADGQWYEVDAPEGMSEGEAKERFERSFARSFKRPQVRRSAVQDERAAAATAASEYAPKGDSLGGDIARWARGMAANYGAGTQNVVDAVKQMFGADSAPTDQEVRDRRMRDKELADSTYGGSLMQILGEVAPTLGVPAGGFVRGARGLSEGAAALGRALTSARTAAPTASTVAAPVGPVAATADATLAGGTVGALMPTTSDESRAMNAALAAAAGGLPLGAIGSAVKLRNMYAAGAAERRAADELVRRLGNEGAQSVLDAINARGFGPSGTRNIPLTAGEISQNPALAAMERGIGSANVGGGAGDVMWAPFRAKQAHERFAVLEDATKGGTPANIEALEVARDNATASLREKALTEAAKDKWFHAPVVKALDDMMSGSSRPNPGVKWVNNYLRGEMDEGITPGQLYEAKKVLQEKLDGPLTPGDQVAASLKNARRETTKIINAIDDALNTSSGGKWQKYIDKYKSESRAVDSAKAQHEIRQLFTNDAAPTIAGVPELTASRVGRALESEGSGKYGQLLDDKTLERLRELRDNIAASEDLQKLLVKSATGGRGGSNTNMDMLLSRRLAGAVEGTVPILKDVAKRADEFTKAALLDAFQNPERFVAVVQKKIDRGQPLRPSEERILRLIRSTTSMPAAALSQ